MWQEKTLGKFLSINEVLKALGELGLSGSEHTIDMTNVRSIAEALESFTGGVMCQIATTINGIPGDSYPAVKIENVIPNGDMIIFDGVDQSTDGSSPRSFMMSKDFQSNVQFFLGHITINSVSGNQSKLVWTISPSEVVE